MNKAFFNRIITAICMLAAAAAAATAMPPPLRAASQREHLTPAEIERVRDNQELDKRIGVFIKAAERRLLAITDPAAAARLTATDIEQSDELKGTRTQLLSDLAGILDEAIVNIDDTADHSPQSPLLKKSLNKLAEAARRFLVPLSAMRDAEREEAERDALENAIERTQEIIEAARKHPADDKEEDAKGRKKKSSL